jgi:hypothetical protein
LRRELLARGGCGIPHLLDRGREFLARNAEVLGARGALNTAERFLFLLLNAFAQL